MAQPVIQSSLNAGELSPSVYGRVDLAKYKNGLALCRNFFVNVTGGIINRPGTSYCGPAISPGVSNPNFYPPRLIPFSFSSTQQIGLVFTYGNLAGSGGNIVRFISNGGYILEAVKTISAVTLANPGVITVTSHGFSNGDLVFLTHFLAATNMTQLNTRFVTVANVTTNTFTMVDGFGNAIDTTNYSAFASFAQVARVYTIASPYALADLYAIKYAQSSDVMTLCHPNYAAQTLTRYANTNWAIQPISFAPSVPAPTGTSATAVGGSGTTYWYQATAIVGNLESRGSNIASISSAQLTTTAGAYNKITCNPVAGATQYYFYRSEEVPSGTPPNGTLMGFIGAANSTALVDNNIAPDFSRTPPQANNPFPAASNTITAVVVSAGGTGYSNTATAAIIDPTGSGCTITPVVSGGVIQSVTVNTQGSGYSSNPLVAIYGGPGNGAQATLVYVRFTASGSAISSVTVNFGGASYSSNAIATIQSTTGTGATLSVAVSGGVITGITVTAGGSGYGAFNQSTFSYDVPTLTIIDVAGTGAVLVPTLVLQVSNPVCVAYYQGRQVFGGTLQNPDQLNFSKTDDYFNFDYSTPSKADDSIQADLASTQLNTIQSLVPFTSLMVFTGGTCFAVGGTSAGGVSSGGAITPSSITAVPQAFSSASAIKPIVINYSVLYVQSKQSEVRDLTFNFYQQIYSGTDISVLASHLLQSHQVVEWDYAQEPWKVVWAVREDGLLLSLTYMKEQEVNAWARHDTGANGQFRSVVCLSEGYEDVPYFIVQRVINGVTVWYVERMQSRLLGGDPTIGYPASLDNAWFVDAGAQTSLFYPISGSFPGYLTPSATTAPGVVSSVDVIAGGSGYAAPVVTVNDPVGSGAVLAATVVAGVITAITVISQGTGYISPIVNIYDLVGTGAVAQAAVQHPVTMTSNLTFSGGNVGQDIRINGGFGTITAVNSNVITVNVIRPLRNTNKAINTVVSPSAWSVTTPVSTLNSGLSHLEGQTVSILANGNVQPQQVVTNGSITLQNAASSIIVGIPIQSQAQSMYIDLATNPTDQTKREKVNAITARVVNSRGLRVGWSGPNGPLWQFKERNTQAMGQPILPYTGDERQVVDPNWQTPAQLFIQQDDPLPAQVNSLIYEIAVGDTPE